MAADEKPGGTKYVVLREIDPKIFLEGDVVLSEDSRIFLTDGLLSEPTSAEQAIKRVAEQAGEGVYATVPERSWDPAEYEVEKTIVVRRKNPLAAPTP